MLRNWTEIETQNVEYTSCSIYLDKHMSLDIYNREQVQVVCLFPLR